MDKIDYEILSYIEKDFEVVSSPYLNIAKKLGIDEYEVLKRIKNYQKEGIIRRLGAIIKHDKVGYKENAMVVWKLKRDNMKKFEEYIGNESRISHAYERKINPDKWKYNFFTMIHANTKDELNTIIDNCVKLLDNPEFNILKTIKELKKTSPVYFSEK